MYDRGLDLLKDLREDLKARDPDEDIYLWQKIQIMTPLEEDYEAREAAIDALDEVLDYLPDLGDRFDGWIVTTDARNSAKDCLSLVNETIEAIEEGM